MNRTTQLKLVVCGVSFVSLSAIHPSTASANTSGCTSNSGGIICTFEPGPQTERVDFFGGHSFKIIVNVTKSFFLTIDDLFETPPGPTTRYPDPANEICIPYVGATSSTPGNCVIYDVHAFDGDTGLPIPPEDEGEYFSGKIIYRVAWDHPTLSEFNPGILYDNPRGLRAPDEIQAFADLTDGVFPTLPSGQDPGVDMSSDGFSQYIVVQQAHANPQFLCFSPLNCSQPDDASLNLFNAGSTVPIKVALNPNTPSADLRLTLAGPEPNSEFHLAESAGKSNDGNRFRRAGSRFEFNWKTTGLAPGVYTLTIAPGTSPSSDK